MLYEAVSEVASAITATELAMDARNVPRGALDALRRAEHHLCDALGQLAADLGTLTADAPGEAERIDTAEMVRRALARQGSMPPD